jgi:hypothetical protein
MATLTTQSINRAGAAPTYGACAGGGDLALPGPSTFAHVKNASGGSLTVTVAVPAGVSGFANVAYGNVAVAVPAGGERMIGPLLPQAFADPTDGYAHITYSGVTSLTIGIFNLAMP